MKKWKLMLPGLLLVLVLLVIQQWPDGRVKIVFCDVGQGDAELVIWKQVEVLIDGGGSKTKVLDCISKYVPFWDREIEMVVNTHPDQDHVGGLPEVLTRFKVDMVLDNGMEGAGESAHSFMKLVKTEKNHLAIANEEVKIGDLSFKVLWPPTRDWNSGTATNARGIVLELRYNNFRTLFTADITSEEEAKMQDLEKVTVLKVAHHGSKYASSEEFLKLVRPDLAVIEVGKNNSYGHPAPQTLDHLASEGIKVMRTDINGDVVVVTDGNKWWVR